MSQQTRLVGSLTNMANMEIATIKGQGQSQKFYQKLSSERQNLWNAKITQQTENTNLNLWNRLVEQTLSYLGLFLSFWMFLGSLISIGTLIVFGQYTGRIKQIFDRVGEVFKAIIELRFDLIKLDFLLNLKTKIDTSSSYPITDTREKKLETSSQFLQPSKPNLFKESKNQSANQLTNHPRINKIIIQNANFTYPKFLAEEKEFVEKLKDKLGFVKKNKSKKFGGIEPGKDVLENYSSDHGFENNDKNTAQIRSKNQSGAAKILNAIKNVYKGLAENFIKAQMGRLGNVAIKNLIDSLEKSFQEQVLSKPVIQDLNLTLESGKIYALVGYNGAGKTTLVNLIKRNLELTSGEINFVFKAQEKDIYADSESEAQTQDSEAHNQNTNEIQNTLKKKQKAKNETQNPETSDNTVAIRNIKTLFPVDIAWQTASMSQNPVVFRMTKLREFFSFAKESWSLKDEERVMELIKKLGLDKKVTSLDLVYGENLELSGGQRQMLDLIRVLIEDKPILILDEGTNQVDAEKEELILNVIKEISKDKIVIFVTHKMTTASKCDQIVVLNGGIIEAIGNHKELLLSDNLYKTFWDLQVI
jgi:ABC-type multidrug transport system fused ATPase/permease subunit